MNNSKTVKSQHTPGPWCIDAAEANETHESIGVIRDNEDGEGVAEIPLSRMADARLIAAAPDLLAALKTVESIYFRDIEDRNNSVAKEVRAAIAKAEGR